MSLTVAEACAINTVLGWLAETSGTDASAAQIAAADRLAEAADRRLGAGWTATQVHARWTAEVTR